MEQILEGAIDNGLETISSGLYIFSIGFGIVLILLGVILIIRIRGPKKKKSIANIGLVCLILGVAAIISGLVQI